MKFTIIGHLCLDVIHHPDGTETKSYGGIHFAVAAMANIASAGDVICPVFGVGEGEFQAVKQLVERYPNVDGGGIFSFAGVTNHVHLFYGDKGTRTECSKDIAPAIPFSRIEPYLSGQGILINMVSGYDVVLETIDQIRLAVRPKNIPIH